MAETKLDVARMMAASSRGRMADEVRQCYDILIRENPAYPRFLKQDIETFSDERLAQTWLELTDRVSSAFPAIEMFDYVMGGSKM